MTPNSRIVFTGASALKEVGKLLEAAEDYEHALRLDPTARDTAHDRRVCLDLLYQQEQLQHEVPRTALPSVAQAADQPKQKFVAQHIQPAELSRQEQAQSASTQKPIPAQSAGLQTPFPAQSAGPQMSLPAQSSDNQKPAAGLSADTRKQQQQYTQHGHAESHAFGGKGQPSCVIEELPNAEDSASPEKPSTAAGSLVKGTAPKAKLPTPSKAKQPSKPCAFSFDRPSQASAAQQPRKVPNAVQSSVLSEHPPADSPAAEPHPSTKPSALLSQTLPNHSSQQQNGCHSHPSATQQPATLPSTHNVTSAIPASAQRLLSIPVESLTAAAPSITAAHTQHPPCIAPSSTAAPPSSSASQSLHAHAASSMSVSKSDSPGKPNTLDSPATQAVPAESDRASTQCMRIDSLPESLPASSAQKLQAQQNGHATAASTSSQAAARTSSQAAASTSSQAAKSSVSPPPAVAAPTSSGLLGDALKLQLPVPRSGDLLLETL